MAEAHELSAVAASRLREGRAAEAVPLYRRLLAQQQGGDPEFDQWLLGLVAAYRSLGSFREAGHVLAYLRRFEEAHEAFAGVQATVEAARCRELHARSLPVDQAAGAFRLAGAGYASSGQPVQAAIALSLGGDRSGARKIWDEVARDPRLGGRPYEQALCAFNLGLSALPILDSGAVAVAGSAGPVAAASVAAPIPRANATPVAAHGVAGVDPKPGAALVGDAGDLDLANRQLIRAQRLLEEVADDFETVGERERAFDCYAILLELGRRLGSFENCAEGYTNCIRVLREDNLKYYVLQYYEDFLRVALEREEFHAAATVAREAADYSRRTGLPYNRSYLLRCAETWWLAAEKNERSLGPVELSENAFLSSVETFSAAGDFFRVRESYLRLVELALPETKRERYRRIALRYAEVPPSTVEDPPFPEYLRQRHVYPAVWELDLVEWELDGDFSSVCGAIVGDLHQPGLVRRRALRILLQHLDPIGALQPEPIRLAEIARGLGELQTYTVLRPLERLQGHAHPAVRRGVMQALGTSKGGANLHFKRSFRLITIGLRDEAPEVRDAALEALGSLHFVHGFDRLVRIFREFPDHGTRVTALTSIGRIGSLEACEFLVEVVRFESEGLREIARGLLLKLDGPEKRAILRRHLEVEAGPARDELLAILGEAG